jgi:hypothetical protein
MNFIIIVVGGELAFRQHLSNAPSIQKYIGKGAFGFTKAKTIYLIAEEIVWLSAKVS